MKFQTLIVILVVLAFNVHSLFAQDSTFSIQSFQPQNIKDGQMYLKLTGSDHGYSDKIQTIALPVENKNDSYNRFGYFFNIYPWLKYESPESFYYLKPQIYFGQFFNKSNSNSSSEKLYPQLDYSPFTERTSNTQSNSFDSAINISGGHYFIDKLGIGGQIDLRYHVFNWNGKYENKDEEVYLDSSDSTYYHKRRYIYFREIKDQNRLIDANITLGPIYGKIYEGKYAARAIEMIAELRRKGLLFKEPNSSQMMQLSTIIYEEMNRYYFDKRIKRIESLEKISNYLISEKIVRETVSAFLTINDIYDLGQSSENINCYAGIYQTFYRPYGFQIGLFFTGGYKEQMGKDNYIHENTEYSAYFDSLYQLVSSDTSQVNEELDYKEVYGNGILGMKISATFAKPFGWHWNLITDAKIEYVKNNHNFSNWFNTSINPTEVMAASYRLSSALKSQLQYYLNSRTRIYVTQSLSFGNLSEAHSYNFSELIDSVLVEKEIPYSYDYKEITSVTELRTTYYLTPRLRLNFTANYNILKLWDGVCSSEDVDFETPSLQNKIDKANWNSRISLDYYLW